MEHYPEKNIWKSALQYGFAIGILSYALSFMGSKIPSFSFVFLLLSLGITLTIFYKGLVRFRDSILNGEISFGKAFQYGFLIALTGTFVRSFTNYFTSNISPEEKEEIVMEQIGALESSGMDPEMLETFVTFFEKIMEPSTLAMLSFAIYLVYGILVTLIVAMIVKKDALDY
jgi:hypothetical protein